MAETMIKAAFLHLAIVHRQTAANRENLLNCIKEAVAAGAEIIISPEMGLSGYSFQNRADIAPLVETIDGPTLCAVSTCARKHRVFICTALALQKPCSAVFTNSAVVFDPDGDIVCRYDKITAESRWAFPGNPCVDNTFDTPWGRVGVLICSDSYYGLMPRVTALRGADLLLVPANWPPSGLNPVELWQARVLENGFALAACNRTGMDARMDCRKAVSCLFDSSGQLLFSGEDFRTRCWLAKLPLNGKGRLEGRQRQKCLASREPQTCHDCYLNLRPIRDITAFYDLPDPGILDLLAAVPHEGAHPLTALALNPEQEESDGNHREKLLVLPLFPYPEQDLEKIRQLARKTGYRILAGQPNGAGTHGYRLFSPNGEHRKWDCGPFTETLPWFNLGPARIHLLTPAHLRHPEPVLAAAKKGGDLVIACGEKLTRSERLLAGVRTIENLAVMVCALNSAGVWTSPQGHQRWGESLAVPGTVWQYSLDTVRTRNKHFEDRIDFERLLKKTGITP